MWGYLEKHTAQNPHKKDRYGGKWKRVKLVKFKKNTKEINSMVTSAAPKKSKWSPEYSILGGWPHLRDWPPKFLVKVLLV